MVNIYEIGPYIIFRKPKQQPIILYPNSTLVILFEIESSAEQIPVEFPK